MSKLKYTTKTKLKFIDNSKCKINNFNAKVDVDKDYETIVLNKQILDENKGNFNKMQENVNHEKVQDTENSFMENKENLIEKTHNSETDKAPQKKGRKKKSESGKTKYNTRSHNKNQESAVLNIKQDKLSEAKQQVEEGSRNLDVTPKKKRLGRPPKRIKLLM